MEIARGDNVEDILGSDYVQDTLQLQNGEIATLVKLPASSAVSPRGAILYLHGFVDYFFQDHVARHFADQGWAWYAIDLRRSGRSLRPGQEPWYTNDLTEYYEELNLAMERIQADGHNQVVLMGHSTGGLIGALWAHDRRDSKPIDALVLNSPWLDLQEPWITRTLGTWVIRALGRILPLMNAPRGLKGIYAQTIHSSASGEWDFDTNWKPLSSQPVKMGFLAAVRRAHARLHRGLDVGVPVLMVRSESSMLGLTNWSDAAAHHDLVLDVHQMKKWLPKLGTDVTDVPLTGALHDVMLSAQPIREQALSEVEKWLAHAL